MAEPDHSLIEEEHRLARHLLTKTDAEKEKEKVEHLKQKIHNWEATHQNNPLAKEHKDEMIDACSPRFKEGGGCGNGHCGKC